MTREMTHDELRDALGAVALDALSAAERRAVLAHATTCPECGPELTALQEAAAALAYAAPTAPLESGRSSALRARLEARAAADAAQRRGAVTPPTVSSQRASAAENAPPAIGRGVRQSLGSWWLAAAASVAFALTAAGLVGAIRERDRLRATLAVSRVADVQKARQLDSLERALTTRDQLVGSLTGPEVQVVELTAAGRAAPGARMFWDRATNRWTMFAYHLGAPAAGRTYQLWLLTRNAKISAGTFTPNPAGNAVVRAVYPLPPRALQAVAVTEEPSGGVPQPTGPVVLVGNATR